MTRSSKYWWCVLLYTMPCMAWMINFATHNIIRWENGSQLCASSKLKTLFSLLTNCTVFSLHVLNIGSWPFAGALFLFLGVQKTFLLFKCPRWMHAATVIALLPIPCCLLLLHYHQHSPCCCCCSCYFMSLLSLSCHHLLHLCLYGDHGSLSLLTSKKFWSDASSVMCCCCSYLAGTAFSNLAFLAVPPILSSYVSIVSMSASKNLVVSAHVFSWSGLSSQSW